MHLLVVPVPRHITHRHRSKYICQMFGFFQVFFLQTAIMFILVVFNFSFSIETFFWGCISKFRSKFFFALNVSFRDLC